MSFEVRIDLLAAYQFYIEERADFLRVLQQNPDNMLAKSSIKRVEPEIVFIENAFKANGLDIHTELLKYKDAKLKKSFCGWKQLTKEQKAFLISVG